METNKTWRPRAEVKRVATPSANWVGPSEKNREAVEKLNERKLMLDQMKLDIRNMTVDFMYEGLSYEDAKSKAELAIDPTNILKP